MQYKGIGVAAFLLSSTIFTAASPALGQSSSAPIRVQVDENGIDLVRRQVTIETTDLTIGDKANGLTYKRYWRNYGGGWRDNYVMSINGGQGYDASVNLGNVSKTFSYSNGTYTSNQKDGSTFVENSTQYIYTDRDGVIFLFNKLPTGYDDIQAGGVPISKITYPTGKTLTFTYKATYDSQLNTYYLILESVNSSTGYQLKYHYIDYTFRGSYDVTLINNAVDYCDPSADQCSNLTQSWPTVSYQHSVSNLKDIYDVVDSMGRVTRYTAQANSQMLAIKRPSSSSDDVIFDNGGTSSITSVTVDGVKTSYAPIPVTGGTIVTDPAGNTRTILVNGSQGEITSDTDGAGHTTLYQYDANGRLTQVTEPSGDYTIYSNDDRGNVYSTVRHDLSGHIITTSATYPSTCSNAKTCNKPTTTTDANGKVTTYSWDPVHGGLTLAILPPDSNGVHPEVSYSYTALHAYYKNSAGSVVASSAAMYLPTGRSQCATAATCPGSVDESRTIVNYGAQTAGVPNNLFPTSVTAEAGNGSVSSSISLAYDAVGNRTSVDGPLSGTADTSVTFYNADREVTGQISADPDGSGPLTNRAQKFTYNADGQVTRVDAGYANGQSASALTSMTILQSSIVSFDASGRKTRTVASAGGSTFGVTDYSYDTAGRADCVTVRMNTTTWNTVTPACTLQTSGSAGPDRITKVEYDADNRVYKVTKGFGSTAHAIEYRTFTDNGQIASVTDADANKTSYTYDGFGRLVKAQFPSSSQGALSSSPTDYEQYQYDDNGNIIERDLRGYASDNTQKILYGYDNLNRLTSKNLPGTEPDVSYGYDLLGRPTSMSQAGDALGFSYDALGRLLTEQSSQGTLTSTWDSAGRRTMLRWADGFYVNYDYDTLGEMTKVRENGATSGIGVLAAYSYDNLGDRIGATYGNGTSASWTPDAMSRLQQLVLNLGGTSYDLTRTFGYNAASQISSASTSNDSYVWNAAKPVNRNYATNGLNQYSTSGSVSLGYDTRGNLTNSGSDTFSYSSENLLKTGPGGVTLTYDPLLRLHQITQGANVTQFAYDGQELVAEYNASNVLQHRYVFGPSIDDPIVQYDGSGTTSRTWLASDERGSVIATTNSSGSVTGTNSYDDYGIPGSSNSGRFQYTGQVWIPELGLYYYKARFYSPSLGRFMQIDPIGYADGMNWYTYAGDDPTNESDTSGQSQDTMTGTRLHGGVPAGLFGYSGTYDSEGQRLVVALGRGNCSSDCPDSPGVWHREENNGAWGPWNQIGPAPTFVSLLDSIQAAGMEMDPSQKVFFRIKKQGPQDQFRPYQSLPLNARIILQNRTHLGDTVTVWLSGPLDVFPSTNMEGIVYQIPGSEGYNNSVRISAPNRYTLYPYITFTNGSNQRISPFSGQTTKTHYMFTSLMVIPRW